MESESSNRFQTLSSKTTLKPGGRRCMSQVDSCSSTLATKGERRQSKASSLGAVSEGGATQPLLATDHNHWTPGQLTNNTVGGLSVVGESGGGSSTQSGVIAAAAVMTVSSECGMAKDPEDHHPKDFVLPERVKHPTSYLETLVHVLKGNIGSGMFAMGEAFKHAGLLVGSVLTLFLGFVCIYNNHVLLKAADFVREKNKLDYGPGFSETVELCFEQGIKVFRDYQGTMRRIVKVFVIITQLGFCCVYVVLVSSTLHTVMKHFGVTLEERVWMMIIYIPILVSCLITTLKFLAPVSLGSNICVIGALLLTVYVASKDGLPPVSSRSWFAGFNSLPLFLGTVIYAFEGIGLILPLQNEMNKPKQFGKNLGVLNVGLSIVTALLIVSGFVGYLRYGDEVKGSLSLNIPSDDHIGILVQIIFAVGIGFSYPLQFYVAADIVWDDFNDTFGPYKERWIGVMLTRICLVTATFLISAVIPNVGLFISLIGAVCATALALVFPAIIDITLRFAPVDPLRTPHQRLRVAMDVFTLLLAIVGFSSGTYVSVRDILDLCIKGKPADVT